MEQERKKLVFKNTDWGDKVLDPKNMQPWNYDSWLSILTASGFKPEPEPFRPTFIRGKVISGDTGEIIQDIESDSLENFQSYFADFETAEVLAKRYGGKVIEQLHGGLENGPRFEPPMSYAIQFPSGQILNAGLMASYFIRMPEDVFSGAAEKAVNLLIEKPKK